MKNLTLVIGASGVVGSEVVKNLRAAGYPVRATSSKRSAPSQEGVELAHVNLSTGEGIKQAFEGVERAFLLSPSGNADQYRILSPLIQEAKRRGLKKVVLMSAMGANAVETSPLRRAEKELESSGLSFNIIRPNWFLQNFNTFWISGIKSQSQILVPGGTARVSFIDTRDIGAVAAKLLVSHEWDNKDFDLTGPQSVTHSEVAAALSTSAGKKIGYTDVSPVPFKEGLLKAGLPEDYSDFLLMIFGFLREGYAERTTSHVQTILGRPARGLSSYATDYQAAFK